jgi:hypothetical protein
VPEPEGPSEVHDFTPPPSDSSDDDGGHSSDSSDDDGYLGYNPGSGLLRPRPRVHWMVSGTSPDGAPWPSLPSAGGGASWSAWSMLGASVAKLPSMGVSRTHRRRVACGLSYRGNCQAAPLPPGRQQKRVK